MFIYRKNNLYIGQISILLFKLIGIYKPVLWKTKSKIFLYNLYSLFTISIVFFFIFSIFMYIIVNLENIDGEMETFFYFLVLMNNFNKMISILLQRSIIIESKNLFRNELCQPRDEFEFKIQQQTSNSCR